MVSLASLLAAIFARKASYLTGMSVTSPVVPGFSWAVGEVGRDPEGQQAEQSGLGRSRSRSWSSRG